MANEGNTNRSFSFNPAIGYHAHAEKCPVCLGTGKINRPIGSLPSTTTGFYETICHGCGGKGWVTVWG